MYDKSLVVEILTQIENAIKITLQRFEVVDSVDYFTNTPQGMEKLDSICMQLIAIGESLKNIDKITNKELLEKYPQIDLENLSEGLENFTKETGYRNSTNYARTFIDNLKNKL